MNNRLFKEGLEIVVNYVLEALKEEIKDQIDLVSVSDDLWGNEEHHCNYNVAFEHLKIVLEFLWMINEEGEVEQETLDGMYLILYDEPYYKFNITEIIGDSDVEVDANDFNKILISYLKGECSIDDLDDDNDEND